jgi:hypothetical protein
VLSAVTRAEAAAVYNFEVADLHSYAVGLSGALVHNPNPGDYEISELAKKVTKEAPTAAPTERLTQRPARTPATSAPGGVPPKGQVTVTGTTTPAKSGVATPWKEYTENTPKQLKRKPQLPQNGTWSGVEGESKWTSPDGKFSIEFRGQYPVYQPVHGVEVRVLLVGRIDTKRDFRKANEKLGEMLKTDAALRDKFGVTEQWVKDNLLHQNGSVNAEAVKGFLTDVKKLTWHHHQDMRRMQLVNNRKPYLHKDVPKHAGGEAYTEGVLEKLIEKGVEVTPGVPLTRANVREVGLTDELIQKARELGIIPRDFPW